MTQPPSTHEFGARRAVTSAAQDRLWFVDTCVRAPATYHVCRAYRVTGELRLDALRTAWAGLVARHESLRTTLTSRAGRASQLIAGEHAETRSFTDLGNNPALADDDEARLWCAELAATPLDLAVGPLARLTVARVTEHEHLLVLLLHRAITDDESTSILIDELSTAYAAERIGRATHDRLPPPRAQYADFARWQCRRIASGRFRAVVDWWATTLTPAPPPLVLPADQPRTAARTDEGGLLAFDWDERIARPLAGLAAAHRTTPFAVLLTAFQALLHRYTAVDRIAVAVPVPVRSRQEFARIIGACREPIVVCGDISGRPSFRTLLDRITMTADDALRHRGLPFDQLVRLSRSERDPRVAPLSAAGFVYRGEPEAGLELPGAIATPLRMDATVVNADLTLTVDRVDPVVSGSLAFRAMMFERSSAQRVLDQLRTLLAAALADPDLPVDALPLDKPRRVRAAVRDADWIDLGDPVRATVAEQVHRVAERQPDAPAVMLGDESLTYRELVRHAAALTAALRSGDGVAGRPVAVRMPTGPRQVAALLGVLDAGAHLLCLDAADNGGRVRALLADLRPACLVRDGAGIDELADSYGDEFDGRVIDLAELPPVADAPLTDIGLDELAYVTYTSGATGAPKGVAKTQRGFAQFVDWWSGEFVTGAAGRVAQWAAPDTDASLMEIFGALTAGATVYPVPQAIRADKAKTVGWLATERITLLQTESGFARELADAITAGNAAESLTALDHVLLSGAALPGDVAGTLRLMLPNARLVGLYGPTESILATWHEITGPVRGSLPIGRPIPGRQVLVLDGWDRPCPAGAVGQIVIRSPHILPSYVGAAADERSAFRPAAGLDEYRVADGTCYRTGDIGRRRWDGLLEFLGHGGGQVTCDGIRIELADVAATLLTHESIAECAVVTVPDADGIVTRLVAYVVPRRNAAGRAIAGADVWRAHLRNWFGQSTPPVSFTTAIGLPRDPGGNVDSDRLPGPGRSAAAPEAMTSVTRAMATIWAEIAGAAPRSATDSFFAAGGHSLLVPQLLDRIRDRFGVTVSVREYVSHPTLVGLSGLVEDKLGNHDAVIVPQ